MPPFSITNLASLTETGRFGSATGAARSLLWVIVLAAFAVRIASAVLFPNIVHPDETFQYLEQAHRLVYGIGLVPWEYIAGVRSWLFPGLIAGVIEVSRLFGDNPDTSSMAVAAFMAALSLSSVVCGYLWGWRVGGIAAAAACGVLNAVWFELIYFAPHALSENMGASALVVGLYLIYPGAPATSAKRLALGGFMLGLAFTFRFQLGPAILVAVVAVCRADIRHRYLPLLLAAAVPVLLAGFLDMLTWRWPFQSILLNFWMNIVEGLAVRMSHEPWDYYLRLTIGCWGAAFGLMIILAIYGGRWLPVLVLAAATIFLTLSLSAHKEYRFYAPALPLIMTLVGVSSAYLAERVGAAFSSNRARVAVLCGMLVFWTGASAALSVSRVYHGLWLQDRGSLYAMRVVNADPTACGVGISPSGQWNHTGGYAHLRTGLSLFGRPKGTRGDGDRSYNYLISYDGENFTALGFSQIRCWAEAPDSGVVPICLWHRAGDCSSGGELLRATAPSFVTVGDPAMR